MELGDAVAMLRRENSALRDHIKLSSEQRERLIGRAQLTAEMMRGKSEHIMSLRAEVERLRAEWKTMETNWINVGKENERLRALLREGDKPFETLEEWIAWKKRKRAALGEG